MPTILLTGATGFVGSHILKALVKNGYRVIALIRPSSDPFRLIGFEDKITICVNQNNSLLNAFKDGIDIVIHTACLHDRNSKNYSEIIDSNLNFGVRLLDLCKEFDVKHFINTDTFSPKNNNVYSLSKYHFVEYLNCFSGELNITNLKLQHVYGPNDNPSKFIPWLISAIHSNLKEIKLTSGIQLRDFIYIDDVVDCYMLILRTLNNEASFRTFDVGTGVTISLRKFVEYLFSKYQEIIGPSNAKLNFGAVQHDDNEIYDIDVNIKELLRLGWSAKIDYKTGINKLLEKY